MREGFDYGFDSGARAPDALRREAEELEQKARNLRSLAASTERQMRKIEEEHDRREAAKIPVDRDAVTLTDGSPVTPDHRELGLNGQQKGYVVLSEAERAKGFVRPVRTSYVHEKCGAVTSMGRALAETYARDPYFYSGTFCATCRAHFPVGEDGEFTWHGTDEKVGT